MTGSGDSPTIPRYSVAELNGAVASLLERGFAPRFLLDATVSRPQLKKGHLWMTLVDGQASITAVVWASQLARLSFVPADGDGVVVVGKLNFWSSRASLCVQALEIRPSLSSVLRQFEQVRDQLAREGLLDPARKRPLPPFPQRIALLTSCPSSALADMLRTAAEPAAGGSDSSAGARPQANRRGLDTGRQSGRSDGHRSRGACPRRGQPGGSGGL
jgi:exodeoxyribonuclease VII large subunit